jgi:hypothetical protein
MLFREPNLDGERRADDVFPAHANGIPLSRDRWLILCSTRGWQGVDDERSIIYQVREGAPNGRVLREGWIARSIPDWDPLGRGDRLHKEHGHPVAFGVPKGALIGGRPAPHANLFVVKWRVIGKRVGADGRMEHPSGIKATRYGQGVEWLQCRLNNAGDDLDLLQPAAPLRQQGFEMGARFCPHDVEWMNQTFVPAVPFNADATEWADVNHFDRGRIAPLKYRFNPKLGLYEWVECGPLVGNAPMNLMEASLARDGDSWVVAARSDEGLGAIRWMRTADPFHGLPEPVAGDLAPKSPLCVFTGPDGILRLITGDPSVSPHRNARDPLYLWEVEVATGFRCVDRRVVFDSVAAGLPIRKESVPRVDMGKLLPHMGGRVQHLLHRVRTKSINHAANTKAVITPEEKACSGVYHATVTYDRDLPPAWTFA